MKSIIAVCIFFCLVTISSAAEPGAVVYESAVISEDTTWRGSIVVKGFVIVAPQATLRIEQGTVVRFAVTTSQQLSNLVVHGRLHVSGTSDHPVILTSDRPGQVRGAWGGVILLSTEKRNVLERCRIENAETGIDVRYSSVSLKSVTISNSQTALLAHDGFVQMSGSTILESDSGIQIYNSEFEGKDNTIASCQRGCVLNRSSFVLGASKIMNNQQIGLEADESRIKISGSEFSGNTLGARMKNGEGQIVMSSFLKNRQTALHLSGSRMKIQRCMFAENSQDAMRTEDGRALIVNNAFSSNGGYNLYNAGNEVVSARQNWWGAADQSQIEQKVYDGLQDRNVGVVKYFPWLNEKPQLTP